MFWNDKKSASNPLGIPLSDLSLGLGRMNIEWSMRGSTLLALHGAYTTRVEVVPAQDGASPSEPIRAVVRVMTELPKAIQSAFRGRETEAFAEFNSMSAFGAMTTERGTSFVGSRLTIFEQEEINWRALHMPLLLFATSAGARAILGAIARVTDGGTQNSGSSAWGSSDFSDVKDILSREYACSSSEHGLTAELGLHTPSEWAAAGRRATALLRMTNDEPHPELGAGLFCTLTLPHTLPSERHAQLACRRLNLLEMEPVASPPHFGAWCPGSDNCSACYVSFFPNDLYAIPGITSNIAFWSKYRADWAAYVLPTLV